MTATITALYAALDEPDADVTHVLGLLADAYMDVGDEWRSEAARWLRDNGKRPGRVLDSWAYGSGRNGLPVRWCEQTAPWNDSVSSGFRDAVDGYHALRTRGEEPVPGLTREGVTT